jgi:hypothetical protein
MLKLVLDVLLVSVLEVLRQFYSDCTVAGFRRLFFFRWLAILVSLCQFSSIRILWGTELRLTA